jgi:hypothetical protein
MVNSIVLTTIKSKSSNESIFDGEAPVAAPLNSDTPETTTAPKAEATKTATPAAKTKAAPKK